jgi:hypothetical protein
MAAQSAEVMKSGSASASVLVAVIVVVVGGRW